ncbi:hypothetical protein M427DRAFT_155422 [Gonapodya prolifera JEL478]|uniref:C2H2-type domain-containing protein n=1 Tax=Gonapodya prolifera (strain JEL478) TaxID=1344416 RepID=A0A139AEX5_GONPJ|nr:hypothetical protein M427DRAFT_155422 [Gonapodya prolifera JEL478]|eukprot:KXS15229.1 hypothetical protein M427DRAFT_155422 [Gonapodya prolifera JEL478]
MENQSSPPSLPPAPSTSTLPPVPVPTSTSTPPDTSSASSLLMRPLDLSVVLDTIVKAQAADKKASASASIPPPLVEMAATMATQIAAMRTQTTPSFLAGVKREREEDLTKGTAGRGGPNAVIGGADEAEGAVKKRRGSKDGGQMQDVETGVKKRRRSKDAGAGQREGEGDDESEHGAGSTTGGEKRRSARPRARNTPAHPAGEDGDGQPATCHWDKCSETFPDVRSLGIHVENAHCDKDADFNFACLWEGCTEKGVDRRGRASLINHTRAHTGDRPFACPHCTSRYLQSSALSKHIQREHKDLPGVAESIPQSGAFSGASGSRSAPALAPKPGPTTTSTPAVPRPIAPAVAKTPTWHGKNVASMAARLAEIEAGRVKDQHSDDGMEADSTHVRPPTVPLSGQTQTSMKMLDPTHIPWFQESSRPPAPPAPAGSQLQQSNSSYNLDQFALSVNLLGSSWPEILAVLKERYKQAKREREVLDDEEEYLMKTVLRLRTEREVLVDNILLEEEGRM